MAEKQAADVNGVLREVSLLASRAVPALKSVDPQKILFVFNPALKSARARILPLRFDSTGLSQTRDLSRRRPSVKFGGVSILYVIEYSRAFLRSDPESKLDTVLHELLHVSPFFNGTLSRSMRHSKADDYEFQTVARAARATYISAHGEPQKILDLSGECILLKWREPFSLSDPRPRTTADLARVTVKTGC